MQLKTRSKIPESAFIPKPARVMGILHLCLAFTMLCWVGGSPFLGDMLEYKKKVFLFQTMLGGGELVERTYASQPEVLTKLNSNRARFAELEEDQRSFLLAAYEKVQDQEKGRGFLVRLKNSFENIFIASSPWFRAWLLLGLVGAILLLKKSSGAPFALWILPVIVVCWWIGDAQNVHLSKEDALYPTEKYLISHYSERPLEGSIAEQQKALTLAWEGYLSAEWSKNGEVDDGEWRFQLERLKLVINEKDRAGALFGTHALSFINLECVFCFCS